MRNFLAPCFLIKNNPELRQKLEKIGYKDKSNAVNPILYVASSGDLFSTCPNYPSFRLMIKEKVIDCGMNEPLFLAIAALRDDRDYMQWFTDGNHFVQCLETTVNLVGWRDFYGTIPHKATVAELQEHFKTND